MWQTAPFSHMLNWVRFFFFFFPPLMFFFLLSVMQISIKEAQTIRFFPSVLFFFLFFFGHYILVSRLL